jgi:hypothetical protein
LPGSRVALDRPAPSALILIVRDVRMLLLTVTAFTVAHSITLSLAVLGVVHTG